MKRFTSVSIVVLALVLMIGIGSSHAIPTLMLKDGVINKTILDNDGVYDTNPILGVIGYSSSTTEFQISWAGASSSGHTPWGDPTLPQIDLASVMLTSFNPGVHTMSIKFSDTDLGPLKLPEIRSSFSLTGTTNATAEIATYMDVQNVLFGEGLLLGSATLTGPNSSESDYMRFDPMPTGLVSLTSIMTITHTGAGNSNVTAKMVPTPEPGTLMLLGSGLAGIGFYKRRRKK